MNGGCVAKQAVVCRLPTLTCIAETGRWGAKQMGNCRKRRILQLNQLTNNLENGAVPLQERPQNGRRVMPATFFQVVTHYVFPVFSRLSLRHLGSGLQKDWCPSQLQVCNQKCMLAIPSRLNTLGTRVESISNWAPELVEILAGMFSALRLYPWNGDYNTVITDYNYLFMRFLWQ